MNSLAPVEQPLYVYERFSRFEKLLRVTTLVLKFIRNLRLNAQTTEILPDDQGNLKRGHKLILKDLQNRNNSEERADLKTGGMVSKQSSLFTLAPFLDEEVVIRIKGR